MAENERDIVKELLARFGIGDEGNPGSSPEPDPVARVGSLVIPERPETLPPVSLERRVPAARPERPAPSEKRPTPPEEVVEQVKEKLSEIREILDSLKEVVSMMKEIQEERMHVVLDPFKVAEFMGTGHGSFVWARLLLPKTGVPIEATILVPENEVWWLTFAIFGDAPSSSFTVKYRALNTRMVTKYEYAIEIPEILYHEGWIGEPLCCPPDTLVMTRRGEVPINKIGVGDEVLTGKGRFKPVSRIISRYYDGKLVSIRPYFCDPIRLTPEHPVYVFRNSNFLWVPAAEVLPGDYVVVPPARTQLLPKEVLVADKEYALVRVESVSTEHYRGEVFNLEVEDDGTYTAEGFIVHNCAEGWTRFDTSLTAWLRNVTGDPNYTDLPNQDVIVKYTAFLYVIEKRFADEMEVHIDSFFRRWARVTRPLARRFMIPGKDISVAEYERGEE